jgi:deferrochelatase/peroxidase EfeB
VIDLRAQAPLDTDDPAAREFLDHLQGNILKGHGRNFTANIFLEFLVEGAALSAALRDLTDRYVTSASGQLAQSRAFKTFGLPGSLFGNVFLTPGTYEKLGLASVLGDWFADPPGARHDPQQSFLAGMHAAAGELGDAAAPAGTEPLEQACRNRTIDALLLLGDDAEAYVLREARAAVDWLEGQGLARVLAVEIGRALRNEDEEGIEHFGYVDGRSQPLFLASDFTGLRADGGFDPATSREKTNDKRVTRETGRVDTWNPFAPLSLALLRDPGTDAADAYGSYYVFRKLEQDVLHFCMAEQALADALGLQGSDRARAGAMVIGRFRDGTPLALNETDGFIPAKANNFRYDGLDAALQQPAGAPADLFALKCPFQAHIRRVNPRQCVDRPRGAGPLDVATENEHRDRRIARRGVAYGERKRTPTAFPALDDLPTGGVGLLFACFQSSIVKQFAFLQMMWVKSSFFPLAGGAAVPGRDPLLAADPSGGSAQRWRKEYGGDAAHQPVSLPNMDMEATHPHRFGFGGFVTFKGGEYFFAPSLPFLRNAPTSPPV